jgi:hypothetical protein
MLFDRAALAAGFCLPPAVEEVIKVGRCPSSFVSGPWSIGLLPVLIIFAGWPGSSGTFPLQPCARHEPRA